MYLFNLNLSHLDPVIGNKMKMGNYKKSYSCKLLLYVHYRHPR